MEIVDLRVQSPAPRYDDYDAGGLNTVRIRDTGQAVSPQFPTAVVRFDSESGFVGLCGGESLTEAGFIRILPFRWPINFSPNASH
jgi:hypothetical protein